MGSMARVMQKIRGEGDPPEETQASTSPETSAEMSENPPPADSETPVEVVDETQTPPDSGATDTSALEAAETAVEEAAETPVSDVADTPEEMPTEAAAEEVTEVTAEEMAAESVTEVVDDVPGEPPVEAVETADETPVDVSTEMPVDVGDDQAMSDEAAMAATAEIPAEEDSPAPVDEMPDPVGEAPPEEVAPAAAEPESEPVTTDTAPEASADEPSSNERHSAFVAEPPPDIDTIAAQAQAHHAADPHAGATEESDTVQWNPKRVDPVVVAFHDRYSAHCEQYRSVRARLLTMNASRSQQVLAITSSVPEEGKSVSTINLGMVMAEGGEHHILVVDADFRRTSIARMLGVPGKPGLANLLNGEVTLEEAVQPTPFPNLKLLPAGEVRSKAYGDLLGGPAVTAALDECRMAFDYTFIDTPPVTTVSDVCLLAPYCDGAIMIVEMRRTPEPTVQQAVRTLQANNVKVLGCLLSRFRDRGSGYYEHYYSSYYNNR